MTLSGAYSPGGSGEPPHINKAAKPPPTSKDMKTRLVLLSLLLLATSAFIARASKPEIVPAREPLSGLPMQIGSWMGHDSPPMDPQIRGVLGVDDYIDRTYYSPELFPAGLYVGYYRTAKKVGAAHDPLVCFQGQGWQIRDRESGGVGRPWGFGVHAANELCFDLPDMVQAFHTRMGLDRIAGDGGCVRASIYCNEPAGTPLSPARSSATGGTSSILLATDSAHRRSGNRSLALFPE